MSSNTVYLVTGAARGLGKGFVATYLARPSTTVIAAVRNPSSSESLKALPIGDGSKLVVVEIDSREPYTIAKAVSSLEKQGISKIDVVIANAAISTQTDRVADAKLYEVKEHVEVNAYGPLVLFQACLPLLQKSSNAKFAAIGSPMGSITGMESRPFPTASYGMSKVILHWMVRKIHQEHDDITAFVLDPGFVQTDMGNDGARRVGMEKAFISVEESIKFLIPAIDGATKEATSGHFPSIEGGDFAW